MSKQPAIEPECIGCLCCGGLDATLPMDARIAVGFGDASLRRNDEYVWSEAPGMDYEACMTVQQAEDMAARDPEADWRIVLYGPLRSRTYQRHGKGKWCLIEEGEGFA